LEPKSALTRALVFGGPVATKPVPVTASGFGSARRRPTRNVAVAAEAALSKPVNWNTKSSLTVWPAESVSGAAGSSVK
jgi:hypothetical protein